MITSTHNEKVKWVRSLLNNRRSRYTSRAFVVEGVRLVEEALSVNWETLLVFYSGNLGERGQLIIESYAKAGVHLEEVSPKIMRAISDTQTPQGILAVLSMAVKQPPNDLDFILITDGVRDPGNLGTILRTASSVGVDVVILSPKNADAYSPKVVRSAMGAHFHLPIVTMNWAEIDKTVGKNHLCVYLAAVGKGALYNRVNFTRPLAIILGGEAAGHSQEAQKMVDEWVKIPMPGGGESLNVAIAAAILMYEVLRQRNLS
jgi:RNA methyltransferase, TrmH family